MTERKNLASGLDERAAPLAIVLRTALLLLAIGIVVRKAWPSELLSTPLAQLTLGGLLWALLSIAIGFLVACMLVGLMIHLPAKDRRSGEWVEGWTMAAVIVCACAAFVFLYEPGPRTNPVVKFLYNIISTAIGWLIS
jgi:hypothetical protein